LTVSSRDPVLRKRTLPTRWVSDSGAAVGEGIAAAAVDVAAEAMISTGLVNVDVGVAAVPTIDAVDGAVS
jgi:hypothetical protein